MSTKYKIKSKLQDFLHYNFGVVSDSEIIELLDKLLKHSQPDKLKNFKEYFIKTNPIGSHSYYIRYLDLTEDDFSYNWLIRCYSPLSQRNRLPRHIVEMIEAARGSVLDQVNDYRKTNCLSQKQVADHYPVPFIQILADWYRLQKEIEIKTQQLPSLLYTLAEPWHTSFKQYHQDKAKFRVLSSRKNSSNGSYGVKIDWYKLINEKEK
jgi:hypothetical protein